MKTSVTCLFIVLLLSAVGWAKYSGGTGETNDPYLIAAVNDLNSIGADPNDWDKHFLMTADINMARVTGDQFNIIGYYEGFESVNNRPFEGVFDGNSHTISNFTYQAADVCNVGLFGYIGHYITDGPPEFAIIQNLGLVNPQISVSGDYVGGLIGVLGSYDAFVGGKIINCYIQGGSIAGRGSVGGIAGCSTLSQIDKCYINTTVSGTADWVGGITGWSQYSEFKDSYAQGSISSQGSKVGGFIGRTVLDEFEHCYAADYVSGSTEAGAFVGFEEAEGQWYEKCFWDTWYNPGLDGIGTGRKDPNLIGLEWELMWQRQTYIDAGWDFVGETANGSEDMWRMCEDMVDYPKLWWQYSRGDFICPDGVNLKDYSYFAGFWNDSDCGEPNECYKADIDNSNKVDYQDLAGFTQNWLRE